MKALLDRRGEEHCRDMQDPGTHWMGSERSEVNRQARKTLSTLAPKSTYTHKRYLHTRKMYKTSHLVASQMNYNLQM